MNALQKMIDCKTKFHLMNIYGLSALHLAAVYDQSELVQMVLDTGCEINDVTHKGRTALMLASIEGYVNVLHVLILITDQSEFRASFEGHLRITAPHLAAEYGRPQVVQMLLDNGCEINETMHQVRIPLMLGPHTGCMKGLQIMIDSIRWTGLKDQTASLQSMQQQNSINNEWTVCCLLTTVQWVILKTNIDFYDDCCNDVAYKFNRSID